MKTKTKGFTKVEKTIYAMLMENTGIALCDSGGESGRSWQRNQKKTIQDFMDEREVSWDYEFDSGATISLFHYLRRDLDLDALCNEFNRKFVPAKDWESEIYGVSELGGIWLKDQGFEIKDSFNSYNGDSCLSQIIQGTWLHLDDKRYLLLQIHGGCDARGGYTDARLFLIHGYEEGALLEDVYGTVTKKDGAEIDVDNRDTMYTLRDEDNNEVLIEKGDNVELYLMEY